MVDALWEVYIAPPRLAKPLQSSGVRKELGKLKLNCFE